MDKLWDYKSFNTKNYTLTLEKIKLIEDIGEDLEERYNLKIKSIGDFIIANNQGMHIALDEFTCKIINKQMWFNSYIEWYSSKEINKFKDKCSKQVLLEFYNNYCLDMAVYYMFGYMLLSKYHLEQDERIQELFFENQDKLEGELGAKIRDIPDFICTCFSFKGVDGWDRPELARKVIEIIDLNCKEEK